LTTEIGGMLALAFLVAAALVPVLKHPARRLGLVDRPGRRKRHHGAIPLTGGIAMFLGFLTALLINPSYFLPYASLIAGMASLLCIGLLDDLIDLRAMTKLIGQLAIAVAVVYFGDMGLGQLGELLGERVGPIGLGPLSLSFTVLCVVFLINAINMSDGIDGLAGGSGMFILLMLALLCWLDGGEASLSVVCLVLATSILGFLVYNLQSEFRRKASAFMGDAGSMMLGFAIAWFCIAVVIRPNGSVHPVTIAWLLLIPSMDTFAVSVRRMSQGRSPMSADRSHLHHIIRRCGFSERNTVRIIHLLVLTTGGLGILGWRFDVAQWLMFLGAALAMIAYTLLLFVAPRVIRWERRRRRQAWTSPKVSRLSVDQDPEQPDLAED